MFFLPAETFPMLQNKTLIRPTSIHRVWHPSAARSSLSLSLCSLSPLSLPPSLSTGLKVSRSPGLLFSLVIYQHPEVPPAPGLIYLLSVTVTIRQIAGGKRGIILSADVTPSEWDSAGLGYGILFKVDAEIHPRALCPAHTL